MREKKINVSIDAYFSTCFRAILLLTPLATIIAGSIFTFEKFYGIYENVEWSHLVLFDLSVIIYMAVGIWLADTGIGDDGRVIPAKSKAAKIYLWLVLTIQWNAISYLIPSVDFWGYAFFFVALVAFTLDTRLVTYTALSIVLSMFISWSANKEGLMAYRDSLFAHNMLMRVVCILLSMASIIYMTGLIEYKLVPVLELYANYDTLTGLLNRRSMQSILDEVYAEACNSDKSFSLLMIDIDNFKHVNDTYGHEVGDMVLKMVANTINRDVKKDDFVFRWGGEEILIVLRNSTDIALKVAEYIRGDIASEVIKSDDVRINVTVTIGVSSFKPSKSLQDMLDESDANLYHGKRSGKNMVVSLYDSDEVNIERFENKMA